MQSNCQPQFQPHGRYRRDARRRWGAATVEVALTAPLLIMLVFGGIEISRANMLRNAAQIAATEGAREGILPGATAQKCVNRAQTELGMLQVVDATVQVSPATITDSTPEVTVIVSIPMSKNSLPLAKFLLGKDLIQTIKLSRKVY